MIEVRQAEYEDIPSIMRFIDIYWKKGHILARDKELFYWQFCPLDEVNMVIGRDTESGDVCGILGFIRYNSSSHPDISGSVWKKIRCGNPILGLDLEKKVWEITDCRWWGSPGMNEMALRLGILKGETAVSMHHFYRLGYVKEFKIARVWEKKRKDFLPCLDVQLVPLERIKDFSNFFSEKYLQTFLPYKDTHYFRWRYYEHPIYQYDIYGIRLSDGTIRSAIMCRTVEAEGHKVIRLVDFIGQEKDFGKIGKNLDDMLRAEECEYIDLYMYGMDASIVEEAGFIRRTSEDPNIIPNYFEPFVRENVDIKFLLPWGDFRMFRGDGDQDRPSLPRKKEENMMTREEKIQTIAEVVLDVDEKEVKEDALLEDFETWDSVAVLSFIAVINEKFNRFPLAEEIREYKTVGELMDALE